MHAYAAQRIGLAVKLEALDDVHSIIAEAHLGLCLVFAGLYGNGVKIRIRLAVPQVRLFQGKVPGHIGRCAGSDGDRFTVGKHFGPFGIAERPHHLYGCIGLGSVANAGFGLAHGLFIGNLQLRNVQAVQAESIRRNVHGRALQQPYGIMQAAVLVEVGSKRNAVQVFGVVANDFQHVLAAGKLPRKVYPERRIAAAVLLQQLSVQENLCALRRTFKEKIAGLLCLGQGGLVMGRSPVIGRGMTVLGVIGMRYTHLLPRFAVLAERPLHQGLSVHRTVGPGGFLLPAGNHKQQGCHQKEITVLFHITVSWRFVPELFR